MKKKILIVDDSATIREQVSLSLTQAGFEVIEAVDGEDGIRKLRDNAISAVLCDVHMPGKSGIELLEEIKQDGANAQLPIVMLTSDAQADLVQRGKRAGARAWIVKPCAPHLLVAAIQKLTA